MVKNRPRTLTAGLRNMSARCQTYGLPISGYHSMHERELKVLREILRRKSSEWLESSMQSNLGRYDLECGALT